MKAKRIKILARLPAKEHSFLIVPFGLYCNPGVAKVKQGDALSVYDTWKRADYEYVRHVPIKTNSAICSFMIKSIYGEHSTIGYLHKKWSAQCIIEGLGEDAFSREEVLLIEVKELIHDRK